ncbi:hypothetical protein F5888DRAFT_1638033 [Russula emetica]|nr:hypothetical protein F5888DRAFT_1638033 [Russula emetica]
MRPKQLLARPRRSSCTLLRKRREPGWSLPGGAKTHIHIQSNLAHEGLTVDVCLQANVLLPAAREARPKDNCQARLSHSVPSVNSVTFKFAPSRFGDYDPRACTKLWATGTNFQKKLFWDYMQYWHMLQWPARTINTWFGLKRLVALTTIGYWDAYWWRHADFVQLDNTVNIQKQVCQTKTRTLVAHGVAGITVTTLAVTPCGLTKAKR